MACDHASEFDNRWTEVPPGVPVVTAGAFGSVVDSFWIDSVPIWSASIDPDALNWRSGMVGVRALSNGEVAINTSDRIHIVAADGRTRTDIGGPGDGPGEFRNILGTCRTRGDTLVVYDMSHRRLSVIHSVEGTVVRSFALEPGLSAMPPKCLDDGTFLMGGDRVNRESRTREVEVVRFHLDSASDGKILQTDLQLERTREAGTPMIAGAGTVWYYADPYFSEIRTFDTAGVLLRVLRLDNPVVTKPADAPPQAEGAAGGTGQTRPPQSGTRRQGFFRWMVADVAGRLWIREFVEPGEPVVSSAFDVDGKMLGRFSVPDWLGEHVYLGDPGVDSWLLMRITDVGDILLERYRLHGPGIDE